MITWRTFLVAWAMVGVAATGDSAEAANCKLAQVATWPIRLVHNHLLVDGEINGQKIGVMLDTGAMKTIVFRSLAVRLGLTRKATGAQMFGVGGRSDVEVALVDEFKIGQAERKQLWMLVAGERDVGDDGSVLLGEDFFQAFDVEFDLAHNAVRLFQAQDCDGKSLAYWTSGASEVALEEIDANRPQIIVPIQINGRALSAIAGFGRPAITVGQDRRCARWRHAGDARGRRRRPHYGPGPEGCRGVDRPDQEFRHWQRDDRGYPDLLQRHVQGVKVHRHRQLYPGQTTGTV